jgi:hypothetical protein
MLSCWKQWFLKNAYRAFSVSKDEKAAKRELLAVEEVNQELMAKVGTLTMENEWLKKKSKQALGYEVGSGSRYTK